MAGFGKTIARYILRRPRLIIALAVAVMVTTGISLTDVQEGLIKASPVVQAASTQDAATASLPQVSLDCTGVEQAIITSNVDGDTFKCRTTSGAENYVRLIGIDTPESVAVDASKNCEEGKLASEHTKAALPVGTIVWLTKDTSDKDRYGRWLRFVWLSEPPATATTTEVCNTMYNAQLVSEGWAQAKKYSPDVKCANLFSALGTQAIEQQLGVTAKWA